MDFEKLKGIVDRIHSFGNIHQHLDLIAGLPYEGYDSFHKSFCDVYVTASGTVSAWFSESAEGLTHDGNDREISDSLQGSGTL